MEEYHLELPPPALALFPKEATIFETLSVNTPLKSPTNLSQSSHEWFLPSTPNADVDYLQKLTVLSDVTLKWLVGQLPDAMSNGARSIIHSQDPWKKCLPLWTLRYWEKISNLITRKAQWKLATTWATQSMTHRLGRGVENGDCLDRAAEEVDNILHLLPLTGLIFSSFAQGHIETSQLRVLLSDDWLNTDTMDLMLETVSQRAAADPSLGNGVYIGSMLFTVGILIAFGSSPVHSYQIHDVLLNQMK